MRNKFILSLKKHLNADDAQHHKENSIIMETCLRLQRATNYRTEKAMKESTFGKFISSFVKQLRLRGKRKGNKNISSSCLRFIN